MQRTVFWKKNELDYKEKQLQIALLSVFACEGTNAGNLYSKTGLEYFYPWR